MKKNKLTFLLFVFLLYGQMTAVSQTVSDYDVLKYKLEFTSDPRVPDFSGRTTVYFKALKEMNQMVLDADAYLNIKEVVFNEEVIKIFKHENDQLIIDFPSTLDFHALDSISISYTGSAETSSGYHVSSLIDPEQNTYFLSCTFSEYRGTPKSWWVCKDGLTDKPDEIEIHITHPSFYTAVANGLLASKTELPDGMSTTVWNHKYPIAPYLVAFAVAEYKEYHRTIQIGNTEMPILNYIYPGKTVDESKFIHNNLDQVPSYIQFFNNLYGEYPFKKEKMGHAEWFMNGAMEHSTISFINSGWSKPIIIHELAHQWFGDQITCATWSDIWLNEAFATYSEALVYEYEEDYVEFNLFLQSGNQWILEDGKEGSVYNPEPENPDRTFNTTLTYVKGGRVLHQLRLFLGDDLFFGAVRSFLKEKQFNFVTTEDFKAHLMKYTGKDLNEFFNDWVYGEGYPIFDLKVTRQKKNQIVLKVDQTQSHPSVSFFETLFNVEFIGENYESEIKTFDLVHNHQTFLVTDLPFEVKMVRFNPYHDLTAKENQTVLSNEAIEKESLIQIELNAVEQTLNITSTDVIKRIQVVDMSGRFVQKVKGGQRAYSISVKDLDSGAYVVTVESLGGTQSKKVYK